MARPLEKERRTFEAHKAELLASHAGRFALIKDDKVIDVFDTNLDAIQQGYRHCGNVPFLVKEITHIERAAHFTSNLLEI